MHLRRTVLTTAATAVAALALSACSGDAQGAATGTGHVTEGKLTVATGQPAYSPWVEGDDPASGEGFEAAVAYAVAAEMGFAPEDVEWVRTTFEEAIAPGPKDFDLNLQQFSVTEDRRQAVDFSSPYYETTQVVVTVEGSPAAGVTTLAGLQPLLVGAQTGTTSLQAAQEIIAPERGVQVFNTNDDAKLALQNGTVDAIVVDLPTAFYLTAAELDGGAIVGQLPGSTGGDELAFVLEKDSPLTAEVSAAVDALREDGTLDELAATWLGGAGQAPVLQ
ncbi:amino acid ABC transporter substrate-binding protein [Xylanimonas oleitrophica]|uniref:Amino acid ABC transporter substrate-binding protein n=1 Tax=Xylanimonas oleitrophica TaxID=2607479 RepID=A0A2W5XU29_9MICO|nr:ABC transporter substrate-binding protein [Xylanimonas oleitrophica]PZR53688.1 amino acid ABC transporter substrate-binding protein [Xylanimonas oleitrophica]